MPFATHSARLEGGSALCLPSLQDGGSVAAILQAEMAHSIAAFTLGFVALAIADLPLFHCLQLSTYLSFLTADIFVSAPSLCCWARPAPSLLRLLIFLTCASYVNPPGVSCCRAASRCSLWLASR